MIQDLSGSWCIKGTGESITRVDSPVPLMYHDPDRSWITDPDPDHPKGTQPIVLGPSRENLLMQGSAIVLRSDRLAVLASEFPGQNCKKQRETLPTTSKSLMTANLIQY